VPVTRQAPTNVQVIASAAPYGDIACTGSCGFYVTQFFNNRHQRLGSVRTHWDNNVINNDPSINAKSAGKNGAFLRPAGGIQRPGTQLSRVDALGLHDVGYCLRNLLEYVAGTKNVRRRCHARKRRVDSLYAVEGHRKENAQAIPNP